MDEHATIGTMQKSEAFFVVEPFNCRGLLVTHRWDYPLYCVDSTLWHMAPIATTATLPEFDRMLLMRTVVDSAESVTLEFAFRLLVMHRQLRALADLVGFQLC